MDSTPPNPHQVGPVYEESPAVEDSGSDFYPQSPERNEDANSNPQPSVAQELPATFPSPTATHVASSATMAGVASPESDISSFDDIYNEPSIPADATPVAALPQEETPLPETKPNGMTDSMGNTVETRIPGAGNAVSERQATDGTGEVMPAVSAPHTHGVAADNAPLNGSSSHGPSTDSSDTTSSEDEDSDDDMPLLDAAEQAKILMASAIGQDEEAPRTAHEKLPEFTKPDVIVTPDMAITELGTVERIVELQALIRANTSGSYRVLDSGSVLCLQDRTVIGSVFDIVGRVHEPAYTFGFASEQQLKDSGVTVGTLVYYVDAHSTYVFTQPLQLAKFTDASNLHDEEGEDAEFSDDEKEAEYKKTARLSRSSRPHDVYDGSATSPPDQPERSRRGRGRSKRQRLDQPRGNDPARGNGPAHDIRGDAPMSHVDHDGDGAFAEGYQPLRRPDNLTDLMQRGPQPVMARRQRGRRDNRRDRRDRRDMNRREPNRPGRFDRDNQAQRFGQKNGDMEQRDGRNGRDNRDGHRRGQQGMQAPRGGGSGYGIDSAAAQTHQPFPSSPANAPSASQTDPAQDVARYRQGQYSSYSTSSSSNQGRPYVPAGQYAQNYVSQTPGYAQQSYHDPSRQTQGSDRQYSAPTWGQNRAREEDYTPAYIHNLQQTAASSHSIPAPSIQSPQQIASALQFGSAFISPQAVNLFGALQQAQASGYSIPPPQAQQQPQQPRQGGGSGAATSPDISSILEQFKAHGQQFRDAYR